MKIKDRIYKHYVSGIGYHDLMQKVFPQDEYPNAWKYGGGGGPPGCAMAFGKALRSVGLHRYRDNRVCGKFLTTHGSKESSTTNTP